MDNSELKLQGDPIIEGICEICFQELNQIPIANIRAKYTGGPGIPAQTLRKGQSLSEGPAGRWQNGAGGHCGSAEGRGLWSLGSGSAPSCRLAWDSPVILRPQCPDTQEGHSRGWPEGAVRSCPCLQPAPHGLCPPQHSVCQQFSLGGEVASGQMRRGLSWRSETLTSASLRPGEGPGHSCKHHSQHWHCQTQWPGEALHPQSQGTGAIRTPRGPDAISQSVSGSRQGSSWEAPSGPPCT